MRSCDLRDGTCKRRTRQRHLWRSCLFVTHDLALTLRSAGTSYFFRGSDGTVGGTTFLGVSGQYWPSDDLFVVVGVGLGHCVNGGILWRSPPDAFDVLGLAFNARAGYSLVTRERYSIALVAEIFPSLFWGTPSIGGAPAGLGRTTVIGTALNLQLQYY